MLENSNKILLFFHPLIAYPFDNKNLVICAVYNTGIIKYFFENIDIRTAIVYS